MPFVGLDFHTRRQLFPLAMLLEVEGPASVAAVYASLRAHACYPSALGLPESQIVRGGAAAICRQAERGRRRARATIKTIKSRQRPEAGAKP